MHGVRPPCWLLLLDYLVKDLRYQSELARRHLRDRKQTNPWKVPSCVTAGQINYVINFSVLNSVSDHLPNKIGNSGLDQAKMGQIKAKLYIEQIPSSFKNRSSQR